MEIKRLFNAIFRKLWLILLLSIIGGGIAWYLSAYLTVPVYEAETTVYAMNRSKTLEPDEGLNYQDVMVSRQIVQDFSEIINSQKVTSIAVNELKEMNINQDILTGMISLDIKKESSVVGVRAVSTDPTTAAAVANAVSKAFITQIHEMTNRDIVGILDEAKVPKAPMPVKNNRNIAIGILIGMIVGFAIVYITELFDTTIRTTEDIEYNLNTRVIGIIPEHGIR